MLIKFSPDAEDDFRYFKNSGKKSLIKKILALLESIEKDPFTGTGKPEALKYELSGLWSRRINSEHRLIYRVQDDTIEILRFRSHYK